MKFCRYEALADRSICIPVATETFGIFGALGLEPSRDYWRNDR